MCQAHMHTNAVSSPPLHPVHQGAQPYWPVYRMKSYSLLSALWIYISRKSWCHSMRAIISEESLILMSSCATTWEEEESEKNQPRMNRLFNDFKNKEELVRVFDTQNNYSHGQKKKIKSDFIPLETYCCVQISYCSLLEKIKITQFSWNGQYACNWQYKWQK